MGLTCGNVLRLRGMPSPVEPLTAPSEAADAFWRAMGGEAWTQWLERTGRISELGREAGQGTELRVVGQ